MVGLIDNGQIHACCTTGVVNGQSYIGGLTGKLDHSYISSSYSAAAVNGTSYTGGLVGYNAWSNILSSYTTGPVSGTTNVGGLIGRNVRAIAFLCYWDTDASGQATSACGKGRTTVEMMSRSTFTGWGYDEVWMIDDGASYPYLKWENPSGAPIVDEPNRYCDGDGTQQNPYEISTPEELAKICFHRQDYGKFFVLMNDINLDQFDTDYFWPIGTLQMPFSGDFNGDGHTITNLKLQPGTMDTYWGMFGFVASDGAISNVTLDNVQLNTGSTYCGSLIGYLDGGEVSSCAVDGNVAGTSNVGGIVGYSHFGNINNCYCETNVSGSNSIGGLVGYNSGGTIASCTFSTGSVNGTNQYAGGIVGYSYNINSSINGCKSYCIISGSKYTGGISRIWERDYRRKFIFWKYRFFR